MFEFKKVLDSTYEACLVNGACASVSAPNGNSGQIPNHDQEVAIFKDLFAGDIAAIRQSAKDANNAVSMIQVFTDAIETIADKLAKILQLAKKALVPDYSQVQVEQMQKQLQHLADDINQIAAGTEYNFSRPFSGNGETLSIPISGGLKIDIFAHDFSFDAQCLSIVKDPKNTLSKVNNAITKTAEYKRYLDRQSAYLREVTASIEADIQGVMGADIKDFQPELALQAADYAVNLIFQDKRNSLKTQANFAPNQILKLLKDDG